LRDVADLTPDSQVLDIGCGVGRLALSMSRLLSAEGGYVGIDIVPDGIAWCNNNVRSPHGNLRFKLADVYNKEYNPNGRVVASAYRFPFEDARFDLAVLVSVFTHMLTDEVDNYLGEIARVLAPGGRCFASYFLMNPESTELMERSTSRARFKRHDGPSWTISRRVPALGIAFDDEYVLDLYRRHGFAPDPAIYRGRWCGRQGHWPPGTGLEAQDVIVATKQ
jgi:SAM-dependent methyltransferase